MASDFVDAVIDTVIPPSIRGAHFQIMYSEGDRGKEAVVRLVCRVMATAAVGLTAVAVVAAATAMFASLSPAVGGLLGMGFAAAIITGVYVLDPNTGDMVLSVGLIASGILMTAVHPLVGGSAFAAYAIKNYTVSYFLEDGLASGYINQAAQKIVEGWNSVSNRISGQSYEDA